MLAAGGIGASDIASPRLLLADALLVCVSLALRVLPQV